MRVESRAKRRSAPRSRKLFILSGVILGLLAPSGASASITSVFGTVPCETQASGQRWCGSAEGTTVPSWDGTPIDVSVAFPPASSSDKAYPVVGIYHGYGGRKIKPSSSTAQRWLELGYAVFSITDRGFGESCGSESPVLKTPPCADGYIHLMSRRYEVRDAQYLLGLLADEGVINPQKIGATGQSYGGGMSAQLGALKDRVELLSGELVPWVSPKGTPLKIAATAPEMTWTDYLQAVQPNGSNLDYVANAPYAGALGNHEFGIEKQNWVASEYLSGPASGGFYAPAPAEAEANVTEWFDFDNSGGPYKGQALALQQETQYAHHSAYYTNLSEPPAPVLFQEGWNDDLFGADQAIDYYNKVRAAYPTAPFEFWGLDYGHSPRSANAAGASPMWEAQNEWFAYYIKGEGSEPVNAHGGVNVILSHCPANVAGSEYKAANWVSLAPGEVRMTGAAQQTIEAPGTAPTTEFTAPSTTVCTTEAVSENASAATYKLTVPAGGFTIAGTPTVAGEFSTPGANAQVIARLYDVDVAAGTQQLIGRAIYRPISPGGGFVKQVFQIHPQAWNVAAGHVVKLELLAQDSTYARDSSTPQSIKVKDLGVRLPTIEAPGADGGLVKAPLSKYLPPGYTLARNVVPAAPVAPHLASAVAPNTGVFTLVWEPQAAAAPSYTLQQEPAGATSWSTVASGLKKPEYAFTAAVREAAGTWTYRVSESNESAAGAFSIASAEVAVAAPAPSFTIEALQEIEGSKSSYTKAKLTGKIGQVIDYRIAVKNTGNVSLKFAKLIDANCEKITPSAEETVAPGAEELYSCTHKITSTGAYSNEARIEGSEGDPAESSNKLEAEGQASTFGTTTVGASAEADPANLKAASKYTLPGPGTLSKLSVYLQPTGTAGTQSFEGVVYAESAGAPGALLASTTALAFKSTNAAGWYELNFSAPVKLAAGSYWLGFISATTEKIAEYRWATLASGLAYNVNPYTSGPSNPFGKATVLSRQLSLYATYTPVAPPASVPVNSALPLISGTPQTGQTLSASTGSWSEEPSGYTYQWLRCATTCTAIEGAKAKTYSPLAADVGSTLRVEVTASNERGSSKPALSPATATVTAGPQTFGDTTVGASAESDPANLKSASKFALPSAGTLSKLSLYLQPTGTAGTQSFEGVVYAESAGAPGALLASTTALAFKSTSTAGWYELNFSAAVKLAAGSYWLGFISGSTAGIGAFRYEKVTAGLDYNVNPYTSGPSNPFGSATIVALRPSLYATYTPTGSAASLSAIAGSVSEVLSG